MDIVPILETIRRAKGKLALTTLQIAITFAILVNTVVMIAGYNEKVGRETGVKDEKIVSVSVEYFGNDYFNDLGRVRNDIERDLDALRQVQGVIAATSASSVPLSGEGKMRKSWPNGLDEGVGTRYTVYAGNEQFVDALGLRLLQGRNFTPEEINWREKPFDELSSPVVILSQDLAELMFPGENALGKQIDSGNGRVETVVGVVESMPGRHILMNSLTMSAIIPALPLTHIRFILKLSEPADEALLAEIEAKLFDIDGQRDIKVMPLETLKKSSAHFLFLFGNILGGISVLLLFVTAIGTYSQASYAVAKRYKQIGVRRALGASKFHILRYFLTESLLVTTFGLLVGILIANGVNFLITVTLNGPVVEWSQMISGIFFIWGVALLSSLLPALKAANVPPAVATRHAG